MKARLSLATAVILALIVLSVSGRESVSLPYDRTYTVCFRFGQAAPNPAGIEVTEQIIKEAREHLPKSGIDVIAVRGHASGSEPDVVQLSRRRAEAIRDLLREAGMPRDSFALDWVGDADPGSCAEVLVFH